MKIFTTTLFLVCACFMVHAQHEIKLSQDGTGFVDVNDAGVAVGTNNYYTYETEEIISDNDPAVIEILSINNNGDVAGILLHSNGIVDDPSYKLAGDTSWTRIGYFDVDNPPSDFFANVGDISENGLYVSGQVARDFLTGLPFVYNTSDGTQTDLMANLSDHESGNAFTVDNNGDAYGWYDIIVDNSTIREPVIFESGRQTEVFPDPSNAILNSVNGCTTDGSVIVGVDNLRGFIFNRETDILQEFTPPTSPDYDFNTLVFTDISDNGFVVGYAQAISAVLIRDAVIYHEVYTNGEVVFLQDFIEMDVPDLPDHLMFESGLMGTAFSVSPSGEYIVGLGLLSLFNGGASWFVRLDEDRLSTNTEEVSTGLSIYPTLVEDHIVVKHHSPLNEVNISVVNTLGQHVKTIRTGDIVTEGQELRLNMSDVAAGTYLLRLDMEGKSVVKKFIKM